LIRGLVQGVGFRPFICRLAAKHGLLGEVDNRSDGVSVILLGDLNSIGRFRDDILRYSPPASKIKSIEINRRECSGYTSFYISQSKTLNNSITEISPDIAVCEECLSEMDNDPERIDYPFINCTNCGPRFTIIESLPYDRPNTTMKNFRMCENCNSEYNDIIDRRFHAQPVACNSCGPVYSYKDHEKKLSVFNDILNEISLKITSGKSVAVKGMGGYHLMCDALNNNAVADLRHKKHRDSKPFAVLFKNIQEVRKYCFTDNEEEKELLSWRRPVVILRQRVLLSPLVSNGLNTTGAMLPYMPLHFLLFRLIDTKAVILTSGNISDNPIIIDDNQAVDQLLPVADSLLTYNRQIYNRTDDSVIRIINRKPAMIRRSRGYVPGPVDLKLPVEGILALGAEQKNSFCIGKGYQAIMSQYIGDLKNGSTFDFFTETIDRFSDLFRFRPGLIACDLHPDYLSTQYANMLEQKLNIPLIMVQHHHAHITSCMAEHGIDEKVIGVSLDGTGFGTDGNLWGGEFLIADLIDFSRFSHFEYVPLPGGEKAISEPWRMAYSYLFKYFGDNFDYMSLPLFRSFGQEKLLFIRDMIANNINSPMTSGAGRLFDAVSAILGLCSESAFDSEGPMRLESAIDCETDEFYPFCSGETITFKETFNSILDDMNVKNISFISAKFHNTIARIILDVSKKIREVCSLGDVVLSGGVFQNKYLTEKTIFLLENNDFKTFINHQVPANDGGISVGQLVIASKKSELCV